MNNAIDAVNVCNTAKLCIGFRKETILATAIDDMVRAFHPSTGIKLTDELSLWYASFLARAKRSLVIVIRENTTDDSRSDFTIRELVDDLLDATNVLNTAKKCIGSRKSYLVERAKIEHELAQDAYLFATGTFSNITSK